jgi:hypothetical protein
MVDKKLVGKFRMLHTLDVLAIKENKSLVCQGNYPHARFVSVDIKWASRSFTAYIRTRFPRNFKTHKMRFFQGLITIGLIIGPCQHGEIRKNVALIYSDSLKREELMATIINDSTDTKFFDLDIKGFWIPSQNQLDLVDSIIISAIKTNYKKENKYLRPGSFKEYYKQYVCFIDCNGDSMVFMNAFCEVRYFTVLDKNSSSPRKREDWQHNLRFVFDGGDCFWNIIIKLTKRKYIRFSVNGYA